MSDIPLPPATPRPMTDEEAADLDYLSENYERDIADQRWQSALEWAQKGDFAPLAECLRFEMTTPPDPMAVRNFLADALEGTFKKPRNSKAKRYHETVQFIDINGRRLTIESRYLPQATIIRRIKELQRDRKLSVKQATAVVANEANVEGQARKLQREKGISKVDAIEEARYNLEQKIARYVQNPRPEWGLSRRSASEMFAEIAATPKE